MTVRTLLLPGLLAIAALLLAACSTPGPRERDALRLEQFLAAAGPPVESFPFFRLQTWQGLGPDAIAVWPRINEAYLIRVEQPCFGLEFARAMAVTSSAGRVTRRFDTINFGDQRCRIVEIRPVDAAALKRARAPAG